MPIALLDADGNETIEFCYAEAPANCSDAEMRAVVLAELLKPAKKEGLMKSWRWKMKLLIHKHLLIAGI